MFLCGDFHPGNSSPLAKFKNLIGKLTEIKRVQEEELPAAAGIQFDYQRLAAQAAVGKKMTGLRGEAAVIVDELLGDWEVAKACASALVAYMTVEKIKKAPRQGQNAATLNTTVLLAFFNISVSNTTTIDELSTTFVDCYAGVAILERFGKTTVLFGPNKTGPDVNYSPDAFMVVRTESGVFCNEFCKFLDQQGVTTITMIELLPESSPTAW
jgi:hypothetical protein